MSFVKFWKHPCLVGDGRQFPGHLSFQSEGIVIVQLTINKQIRFVQTLPTFRFNSEPGGYGELYADVGQAWKGERITPLFHRSLLTGELLGGAQEPHMYRHVKR